MQIEAKVLKPGETEIEMRMVATLDQWSEVRAKMQGSGPYSAFCLELDDQIGKVADRLRAVIEGEKQGVPNDGLTDHFRHREPKVPA